MRCTKQIIIPWAALKKFCSISSDKDFMQMSVIATNVMHKSCRKNMTPNCRLRTTDETTHNSPQYTRAFGLIYSASSVSVYSWTAR